MKKLWLATIWVRGEGNLEGVRIQRICLADENDTKKKVSSRCLEYVTDHYGAGEVESVIPIDSLNTLGTNLLGLDLEKKKLITLSPEHLPTR